jgi:hypothetical protein
MENKSLAVLSINDFTNMIKKLEDLNKKMNLHLDLTVHRDHVIEETSTRQDVTLVFTGIVDKNRMSEVDKFKEEVKKMVPDSWENNVRFEITFEEPKKTLGIKDEMEAHSKLEEYHNKMKANLKGIEKASVRMTSKRTYSSKDGEKFSGNLYISGNCPSELKDNFIKYYNEVAKPLPQEFHRHNRARLRNDPSRPHISCTICKTSLDDRDQVFTCLTCNRDGKSDISFCDVCVTKEQELANFIHPHTLVLVPKRNEIRSQPTKKAVTGSEQVVSPKEEAVSGTSGKELNNTMISPFSRSLVPETDFFSRTLEPLSQRFREFERIADRLDREMRTGFMGRMGGLFDDSLFPFGVWYIVDNTC